MRRRQTLSRHILFLAARYASNAVVDIPETARNVIAQIGCWPEDSDAAECTVATSLIEQQKSLRETDFTALENDEIDRITISHQCSVFGFACNPTADLMSLPISLANALARQWQSVWDRLDYISPDYTTQVGVEFIDGRRPTEYPAAPANSTTTKAVNVCCAISIFASTPSCAISIYGNCRPNTKACFTSDCRPSAISANVAWL